MRRLLIVFALLATLAPPALAQNQDITFRNSRSKGVNTVYYDPPPPHLPGYRLVRSPNGNCYWTATDGDWTHWAAQTSDTGKAPTRSMGPGGTGFIAYNGGINLAAMAASPSKAGFSRGGGTAAGYHPYVLAPQHNHAPGDCPDDSCPNTPAPSNPSKPKVDPDEPQSSDPIEQFLVRHGVNPTWVMWGLAAFAVILLLGLGFVGVLLLIIVVLAFRRRNS